MKLRFNITDEGTIGAPYIEATEKKAERSSVPGAALAGLFDDEDDSVDGDVPDVSADFAKLKAGDFRSEEDFGPLTADFEIVSDGEKEELTLVRWPRFRRPAVIPEELEGRKVTAVAATAFAQFHIPEQYFPELYTSPISYSVFSMRMGRVSETERFNEGGPTEVVIPGSVRRIGAFAFWHCDNIREISIPEGVTELPAGVFGDCSHLERISLPEGLRSIGYMQKITDHVMPDMGTFSGCHSLKELELPASVTEIGSHCFNSCGLTSLTAFDGTECGWNREVRAVESSFDHTASLRWMSKAAPDGTILYQIGLPPARDKIISGDRRFGALLRMPVDFFTKGPEYFDGLARNAFRLDFSAQMALSRLTYSGELSPEDRKWYYELLVSYFEKAPQFFGGKDSIEPYEKLFAFLEEKDDLTAESMSDILRVSGNLGLPADFISHLMEVRTKRFSSVTGFEDLDLDLDL